MSDEFFVHETTTLASGLLESVEFGGAYLGATAHTAESAFTFMYQTYRVAARYRRMNSLVRANLTMPADILFSTRPRHPLFYWLPDFSLPADCLQIAITDLPQHASSDAVARLHELVEARVSVGWHANRTDFLNGLPNCPQLSFMQVPEALIRDMVFSSAGRQLLASQVNAAAMRGIRATALSRSRDSGSSLIMLGFKAVCVPLSQYESLLSPLAGAPE